MEAFRVHGECMFNPQNVGNFVTRSTQLLKSKLALPRQNNAEGSTLGQVQSGQGWEQRYD